MLNSACFLSNEDQIYILTSNSNDYNHEKYKIKVYNINGKPITEINGSEKDNFFIDSYYDKDMRKNFIITPDGSYFYEENKIYMSYYYYDNSTKYYIGPKNYVSAILFFLMMTN